MEKTEAVVPFLTSLGEMQIKKSYISLHTHACTRITASSVHPIEHDVFLMTNHCPQQVQTWKISGMYSYNRTEIPLK